MISQTLTHGPSPTRRLLLLAALVALPATAAEHDDWRAWRVDAPGSNRHLAELSRFGRNPQGRIEWPFRGPRRQLDPEVLSHQGGLRLEASAPSQHPPARPFDDGAADPVRGPVRRPAS